MKSTLVAFGWNVSCLKRSCRKRIAKSEACRDARERRILLKITPRRRDLQKNFYDQRKKVIIFSIDGLIVDIEWIPVRWSVGGAGRCDPLNNQSLCPLGSGPGAARSSTPSTWSFDQSSRVHQDGRRNNTRHNARADPFRRDLRDI